MTTYKLANYDDRTEPLCMGELADWLLSDIDETPSILHPAINHLAGRIRSMCFCDHCRPHMLELDSWCGRFMCSIQRGRILLKK